MNWEMTKSNNIDSIINGVNAALNSAHDLPIVRLICKLSMTDAILFNYGLRLRELRRSIVGKNVDKDKYRSLFEDRHIVLQITRDVDIAWGNVGVISDFIVKYNYDLEDYCKSICDENNLNYVEIFKWLIGKSELDGKE